MTYIQFAEKMTAEVNLQNMRFCNPVLTVAEVSNMPECKITYALTIAMVNTVASI